MRVLFYEPDQTGHHFAYLGRMLPAFTELPIEIGLATTPQAIASDEFATCLAPFRERLQLLDWCSPRPTNQIANGWHRLRELKECGRRWQPDHVCIMYAAGMWPLWSLLGLVGYRPLPPAATSEMWVYRGGFAYPSASGWADAFKRALFRRLLRGDQITKVHPVDELLCKFADQIPGRRSEVELAPDPINFGPVVDKQAARKRLGIPQDGLLVTSSGMIERRKGMDLALRAFAEMVAQGDDRLAAARLLLAGPHEAEISALLSSPPLDVFQQRGQLISRDQFLNDEQMLTVAAASDLVLAPYPNHSGRSSIILWAAAAGRPVLGVARGCIQYVIVQQQLGATCDVTDVANFATAMGQMLLAPWTDADQRRVREYARWHSIENYQRLSSSYVRTRCGMSDDAPLPAASNTPA